MREGWAEKGHIPSRCQLPRRCRINHNLAVQLGITSVQCSTQHAACGTMGLFPGGEAASGRGSGGGASFPQFVPRHPGNACGCQERVAKRTRVAGRWQALADLIQLAARPPPSSDSGPAGARTPGSCSLCAVPMHMDMTLPGRPPPPAGTWGSPRPCDGSWSPVTVGQHWCGDFRGAVVECLQSRVAVLLGASVRPCPNNLLDCGAKDMGFPAGSGLCL